MKYKAVKGMEDILPQDAQAWRQLEQKARRDLDFYGYDEIRTPILEDTAVFVRGIGETTDIVAKEMFTFADRKGRSLTLRPEGTAPIVRAYIEHSLDKIYPVAKLYYIGPMFRSERPQKGRSRQFHQIGVEVIGTKSAFADVEIILQLVNILKLFGLETFILKLNSLGCKADKSKFADSLREHLKDKTSGLCDDCKVRVDKNVLRILDCKNESCAALVREAPNVLDSLCIPCRDHFEKVKKTLRALNIEFAESKNLVRGLDYYTGTVFEVTSPALGGQDAIAAGGRYDNLVKDMGGPDIAAVGYALGLERVIIALKGTSTVAAEIRAVYIATLGDAAKIRGIELAEEIKREGLPVTVLRDTGDSSLKSQMRSADKNGSKAVIILGEDELRQKKAIYKDMSAKGEQIVIEIGSVVEEIRKRLC